MGPKYEDCFVIHSATAGYLQTFYSRLQRDAEAAVLDPAGAEASNSDDGSALTSRRDPGRTSWRK